MYIQYGPVQFFATKTKNYSREVVLTEDRTQYLWDHVSVRAECILNQDNNSIGINGGYQPNPPSGTFFNLVAILKQQRQQLQIWNQDLPTDVNARNYILISPLNVAAGRLRCDANNGPRCIVHNIDPGHGQASMIFDVEFQTDINECVGSSGSAGNVLTPPPSPTKPGEVVKLVPQGTTKVPTPLILSNRYSMSVAYDPQNCRPMYHYKGSAIFRTDILSAQYMPNSPDLFRRGLLPGVSNGYARRVTVFELNQGNSALRYEVVDMYMAKSQPQNQNARIAEIHISEQRRYVSNLPIDWDGGVVNNKQGPLFNSIPFAPGFIGFVDWWKKFRHGEGK